MEGRVSAKYDKDQYPWLSEHTLKIRNVFLFLHNEILDFAKYIETTKEDKEIRK